MTLGALRKVFETTLKSVYELDEIRHHFAHLCKHHFGYNAAEVVLLLNQKLSENDKKMLKEDLEKLKAHTPIQYIIGSVDFATIELKVNPSVLIPRPETEELVHWICENYPEHDPINVLDIGTGSGCIALALKKARPSWHISAWDISDDALELAKYNAEVNTINVNFRKVDVLGAELPKQSWDLIVSNPPYVPDSLKNVTKSHVLEHEPLHAIFVSASNPLIFYTHIVAYAMQSLTTLGALYFEGHQDEMQSLQLLLQDAGFSDIVLRNDFRANQRFISAIR